MPRSSSRLSLHKILPSTSKDISHAYSSLVAIAAMMIPLGSCAALQKLARTEVPMTAIVVAGNGVDAAETAATALCTVLHTEPGTGRLQ